jgi:dolichol kinase
MPINAIPTATVCTSIERATDRHRAIIHLSMREYPLNVFARRRIVNVLFRFAVLFSWFFRNFSGSRVF